MGFARPSRLLVLQLTKDGVSMWLALSTVSISNNKLAETLLGFHTITDSLYTTTLWKVN